MSFYLSKSDFKVARTCAAKLYYKKLRYPSAYDHDPYLQFLADGGYMVEAIAKLCHPGGIEIGFDRGAEASAEQTMAAINSNESVTLFEATLIFQGRLARVDILKKNRDRFELIEVKAKSVDMSTSTNPFRGNKGRIASGWKPYLEDVAFQYDVLRCLFPSTEISPYLCLVDKAKTCSIDTIFRNFHLSRPRSGETSGFQRPKVTFTGDVEALRSQLFLEVINIANEVDELMPQVHQAIVEYQSSLTGDVPQRIQPILGVHCKTCEYRIEAKGESGFKECWGILATPEPHLLDLYRVDRLGPNGSVAARLIAERRTALLEVAESDLGPGPLGGRQKIQLDATRKNSEFIDPELPEILGKCPFPLHFLDFETSRLAVPYHAGMRPYEQVAFQWSCHTIGERDGTPKHTEWINVQDAYPNFEFARSLRDTIGCDGSVFVWSPFERAVLRDIRRQLIKYHEEDPDLANWLDRITAGSGPLVDLCHLAKNYYFHPKMKGRLSLKFVLPAVWEADEALHTHPLFSKYYRRNLDGSLENPYETLSPLPFGDPENNEVADEVITEGTGAVRAYQEMLYGLSSNNDALKRQWRGLLLQYCELDTAAMVMVWTHWTKQN